MVWGRSAVVLGCVCGDLTGGWQLHVFDGP